MNFEIDLFFPSAMPGAASKTETLGLCKVLTHPVFVTVTERNGDARLVALAEIAELDRAEKRFTTTRGKACFPRRIDFPDKIYVETGSGHARAIKGDQIARLVRRGDTSSLKVSW